MRSQKFPGRPCLSFCKDQNILMSYSEMYTQIVSHRTSLK